MEKNVSNFTVTADQLKSAGYADAVETIEQNQKNAADAAFYREFIVEANKEGWYNKGEDLAGKIAEDLALYESYATREEYEKLKIELGLGETATADVVELAENPAEEAIAPVVSIDSVRGGNQRRRVLAGTLTTAAGVALGLVGCTVSPATTPTPVPTVSSANPSPSASPSVSPSASPSTSPSVSPSPSTSPAPSEVPTNETPDEQDNRNSQTKKAEIEARDKADAEFFGVSLEQLRKFRKDHGFGEDTKFFTKEATKMMRDGKGKNGMESNLAIGEKLCVAEGASAKDCADELKMAAGANRFLAPYLMSEINGEGGFRSAYENKLENKYEKDADAWRADVEKFLDKSKDYTWKLKDIDSTNVRWTHSMSKRNPGTIAVLQYRQDGTRLVAYNKKGKEVLGVRIECEQGTEAGHRPVVVHKPQTPNKPSTPNKPHKPSKPNKPPKTKLEKKNQSQNPIHAGDHGSHDNSTDNADVSNDKAQTPGGDNSDNPNRGKDNGNEKQPEDPGFDAGA